MTEDKLTPEQRLKLEALSQAVAFCVRYSHTDSKGVIAVAKNFYQWLKEETKA
jgi:hypothetical protein